MTPEGSERGRGEGRWAAGAPEGPGRGGSVAKAQPAAPSRLAFTTPTIPILRHLPDAPAATRFLGGFTSPLPLR